MPILTREDGTQYYLAPDPTPEQIANAAAQGSDPWDRLGVVSARFPFWDFAPDDTLAAAGVIHDEMYLYALSSYERATIDRAFARDATILADAHENALIRIFEQAKALACWQIVDDITELGTFPTDRDRNTDITRAQGIEQMNEAKRWINICARKIGEAVPYAEGEE
jgi:hypothetical protein